MGPPGVGVLDPGPDGETGVLEGVEASGPTEFFLEGLDEAFTEAILLRRIRGDVFLLRP